MVVLVDVNDRPRRSRLELAGCRATRRQTVYNIIHRLHESKVSCVQEEAKAESIEREELISILSELKQKGLVYSPKPGRVVCVDE